MIPRSKRISAIFLTCFLPLICAAQSASLESGDVFAFVSVSVVPMDSARVEADQTVIVRDGHIAEIGPASGVEVPDTAVVIDGHGKFLMPGLADMHAHLAHDEEADPDALVVFLAAGVTTVRNMWGQPVHLEWRKRINDGHRN